MNHDFIHFIFANHERSISYRNGWIIVRMNKTVGGKHHSNTPLSLTKQTNSFKSNIFPFKFLVHFHNCFHRTESPAGAVVFLLLCAFRGIRGYHVVRACFQTAETFHLVFTVVLNLLRFSRTAAVLCVGEAQTASALNLTVLITWVQQVVTCLSACAHTQTFSNYWRAMPWHSSLYLNLTVSLVVCPLGSG